MDNVTGITALDVYLDVNRLVVSRVFSDPYLVELTELKKDIANVIFDQGPTSEEIMLVHGYEIIASRELALVIKGNNDTYYNGDELSQTFKDPILIHPQKKLEISEAHTLQKIPLKLVVSATKFRIESREEAAL